MLFTKTPPTNIRNSAVCVQKSITWLYLRHKHNITSQQPIGHIWNFNQDMIFNLKKKIVFKNILL